jgi:membrane fusion protein (multidrug efflux system)
MSSTETSSAPTQPASPPRQPWRTWVGLALALVVCVWLARFIHHAFIFETTDDAFLAGHVHTISAEVEAPVQEVLVRDNQRVAAGDVLVRLDPLEFDIAARRARAAVAEARAEEAEANAAAARADASLAEARARVGQAEAQWSQAKARDEMAALTLRRDQRMIGSDGDGAVTAADLDGARTGSDGAEAAVKAASANIAAAQAGLGSAEAARGAAQAEESAAAAGVEVAQAALLDTERKLGYTTIKAPVPGRVGNKNVEAGDRVQAGQALLVVVEPEVWAVANFKETQLARIKVGQEVQVSVDALPGRVLLGRVDSFAPASGAEFALLPPDNATGNFTKVVQRVPVKIVLDPESIQGVEDRLSPGLSAVVDVRVR